MSNNIIFILKIIFILFLSTYGFTNNNSQRKEIYKYQNDYEIKKINKIKKILLRIKESNIKYNKKELKKYYNQYLKHESDLSLKLIINKINKLSRFDKIQDKRREFLLYKNVIIPLFEEEAISILIKHLNTDNPYFKGKIVEIISKFEYSEVVLLLKHFLVDERVCQEIIPILIGKPLRICDVTYNSIGIILIRNKLFNKKFKYPLGNPDDYSQNDKIIKEFQKWFIKNEKSILNSFESYK